MFHIHVDATAIEPAFEQFLVQELGFWRSDFSHEFAGDDGYEPAHHLTQKPETSAQFRKLFRRVVDFAESHTGSMQGYIEGEFIALDLDVPERPYDPSVKAPLRFSLAPLPSGMFRETEIHISLDKDRSDPRLQHALRDIGFFAGFIPKPYGVAQVLTVQGSRATIGAILPPIIEFLHKAGGSSSCSVKEERVAKFWVSEGPVRLPPVVDSINWL